MSAKIENNLIYAKNGIARDRELATEQAVGIEWNRHPNFHRDAVYKTLFFITLLHGKTTKQPFTWQAARYDYRRTVNVLWRLESAEPRDTD